MGWERWAGGEELIYTCEVERERLRKDREILVREGF